MTFCATDTPENPTVGKVDFRRMKFSILLLRIDSLSRSTKRKVKTSLTVSKAKFNLVEFKGFDIRSTKGFSDFSVSQFAFVYSRA